MKTLKLFLLCFALATTSICASQSTDVLKDNIDKATKGDANAQMYLANHYGKNKNTQKGLYWLEEAVKQGHPQAQYTMALHLYHGNGVPKNISKAVALLKKTNTPRAKHVLAILYRKGAGVNKDLKAWLQLTLYAARNDDYLAQMELQAVFLFGKYNQDKDKVRSRYWLIEAANNQHNDAHKAQLMLARQLFAENDTEEAMKWFKKAAEQNNQEAQYIYGTFFYNGKYQLENYSKAAYWYEKSAQQGYPQAQTALAKLYEHGEGVEVNNEKSLQLYKAAAVQGYALAQYQLGAAFFDKNTTASKTKKKDLVKSYMWYSLAKFNGYNDPVNVVDYLKHKLTRDQINVAQNLATKCIDTKYKHCQLN